VVYRTGQTRCLAACIWLAYMAWVAWFWCGLTGVGLVCIGATPMLRSLGQSYDRVVELSAPTKVWIMPWAICIESDHGRQWLCRDEVPPAKWAAVLRYVRMYVSHQAVGLSLSN
jgi:hypothetical protein